MAVIHSLCQRHKKFRLKYHVKNSSDLLPLISVIQYCVSLLSLITPIFTFRMSYYIFMFLLLKTRSGTLEAIYSSAASSCLLDVSITRPVNPRQPTRLTTTNAVEINRRELGVVKYLSRNRLPRISLIRGKLFLDMYLLPMTAY